MVARSNPDPIKMGDRGDAVLSLQGNLILLGYALPRWGADGIFGRETMEAVEAVYEDSDREFHWDEELPGYSIAWIQSLANIEVEKHCSSSNGLNLIHDVRSEADAKRRKRKNRLRSVDTVVLHQMAVKDSDSQGWSRWKSLGIHYVVTCGDNAAAYWMHDPVWRMPHAQAFNSRSVGIECEGYFSGIGTNSRYFWKPKSRPNRKPMTPTERQLEACRQAVIHAINRSKQLGGTIKYIAAHRQSYGMKTSDPGELIWRGVALPLIEEGLLEAFPGTLNHSRYPGKTIPEKWGGEKGEPYK